MKHNISKKEKPGAALQGRLPGIVSTPVKAKAVETANAAGLMTADDLKPECLTGTPNG